MGVFTRFKRDADGFRALVQLWETTPIDRRKRMIEVGMAEDPHFAQEALKYLMTFQDVVDLPDEQLAEVMAEAPPRILGNALHGSKEEIQTRFLRCAKTPRAIEVRDYMDQKIGLREI